MTPSPKASPTLRRRVYTKVPFAFAAAFTAMAMAVPQGHAADITWDAATGSFTTGSNWAGGVVPGTSDNAIIGNGGTATITTGDAAAVSRLLLDNGTISQDGGSISTVPFGTFESPGAFAIGSVAGQTGVYNISGASALTGGRVRIGYSGGSGSVTIGNTSTYTGAAGQDTWVGNGTGSVGSLTMTESAQWNVNNDWFVVGRSGGTGTLTMSNTSKISVSGGGNVVFGDGTGGNATVNIAGSTEVVTAGGEVWVGNAGGTGTLNLGGSAKITAQNHWIAIGRRGGGPGGTGTAIVSGNAQLLKEGAAGDRHIVIADGEGSVGSLTVKDSGLVSSNQGLRVGQGGSAQGTLTVQDNATVNVGGELWIGQNAHGTVNLQGGTITVNDWVAVGRDGASGASSGTLNISGGTFNKNGNGNFIVNGATSTVNQTGGQLKVNSGETFLAEQGGKNATWNASGGTANLGSATRIGISSVGTMTISGTANYTNAGVTLGGNAGGNGTLNLNGGTFTANSIAKGAGTGVVNFNGGTLRAGAASATFISGVTANVLAGGIKVDTNGFDDTITVNLSGIGGLTKLGAGTLTLSGAQSYTGNTSILAGTLSIGTTYLADASTVSISAGSVFDLSTGGSDNIRLLIFDGVAQAAGTYGAIGSGAQFQVSYITGTGFLVTAVPEPEHYALGIGALLGTVILLRRRRSLAQPA